jgi:hypothetical protein
MQRCSRGGSAVVLQHGEISRSESMNSEVTRTGTITYLKTIRLIVTEPLSIESFIDGLAFARPYDLAPLPPSRPQLSRQRIRQTGRQGKRDNLLTVGVGEQPIHTTA